MKRSIEFPCDPRWIKNPTNSPLATIGMRMAVAARTKKAIAAVQAILSAHFTPPPLSCAARGSNDTEGLMRPNLWTVRLTRISPGTLDPLTGGASMKVIQDAVARWCGVPDERNAIWTWVEPIGQEKRGQGVYGVRIEIESLEPGEDRIVRLAGVEPRTPKGKRGRPTVGDLHAAAERVLSKPRGHDCAKAGCSPEWTAVHARFCEDGQKPKPAGDPGEEQAACMLVPCGSCGAKAGESCQRIGEERFPFGVHAFRARSAGIYVQGVDRDIKPVNVSKGPRKLATVKPREAWAVLPWAKPCAECRGEGTSLHVGGVVTGLVYPTCCAACEGRRRMPVRWPALDGADPAAEVLMPVPAKHQADHGAGVRMIRRPWRRAGVECWLYEPAA